MEVIEIRKVNTPIDFYLNGELIGSSTCVEKSFSADRIKCAEQIGVKYYDRFVLRAKQGITEADSAKCMINNKSLNDFNNRIQIK